ncbi:uncharacterized protein LOC131071066 [Cryptomeria japonica]|uniref:uncharacterized protein LOC131071066 n=1 Tax=Cryptomeria japonica TaxID=3369 RepID=UPI0025AC72EF|nr:uncharacterized protein LOC131071066 [Cryptomeria japonica]
MNTSTSMGWQRSIGNVRSFVSNSMGGLRGRTNLASWIVAGTLAYFLWIKPEREIRRNQEARAALATNSERYVEKRRPIPDPQDTGLVYGKGKQSDTSEG